MTGSQCFIPRIGSWDFESKRSYPFYLQKLRCTSKEGEVIICGGNRLNLATGLIDNKTPIKSHTVAINGQQFNYREFPYTQGLHFIESRSRTGYMEFYLMEERAFESNLVQMFLLGNYDKDKFKEVFNAVPFMRAFTLNQR